MGATSALKLAVADCIISCTWNMATGAVGAVSLLVGDYLVWEGDRTPLVYSIVLLINLIFVELSVATGGAAWNPTAPMAFYVAGAGDDSLFSLALRMPSMAIGAAAGVVAINEFMPSAYKHTLGPGPQLKVGLHEGAVAEGVLTFLLTLLVLVTVLKATNNRFLQTPIIVAGALTLVTYAGAYTGPAMNPSDAFGWAYHNSRHYTIEHIYVYWFMPYVGALFAALAYRHFFTSPAAPEPREKVE